MKATFHDIEVAAISDCLPGDVLEIASLADVFGESTVRRVMETTGIARVRVARPDETASDLAERAARRLLAATGCDPAEIDGIVFVSQTPDYILPATSCVLQFRLGLPRSAVAFDLNSGCTGFIHGLFQAALLIQSGAAERVLVLVGDVLTRYVNSCDRNIRVVFGDGAGAALVQRGRGSFHVRLHTDGAGHESLIIPAGGQREPATPENRLAVRFAEGEERSRCDLFMDGKKVFDFAMECVPGVIRDLLQDADWEASSVGTFALHQANRFMVDYLRRKMKASPQQVPIEVAEVGNTGPATLPILLCRVGSERQSRGEWQRTILSGFGVGLTWGGIACDLSRTQFVPWGELA